MPYTVDSYVTLAELRAAVNLGTSGNDQAIQDVLAAASKAVDETCWRSFDQTATGIVEEMYSKSPYQCNVRDIVSASLVERRLNLTSDWETVATDKWFLGPPDASLDGRPYAHVRAVGTYWPVTTIIPTVRVTGQYGWPSVPPDVKEATLLLAARYLERPQSPLGAWTAGGEPIFVRATDPDVVRLLAPYRRRRGR